MEPHATTAVWDADGRLTHYETTQHIFGAKELVSIVLGLLPEKITVVSRFLGSGFGGKAYVWPHTLLAALAVKVPRRPAPQMYSMAGHQPATIQTVVLGADRLGKLTGIRHESVSPTPVFDNYIEYAALASRSLWAASGGIATNHRIVHVNRNTPTAMRSPHEALGHFALDSAMDELAYATGVAVGAEWPARAGRRRRVRPGARGRSTEGSLQLRGGIRRSSRRPRTRHREAEPLRRRL